MTRRTESGAGEAGVASSGRLMLIGTPIGNLGDISPRAVDALSAADVIFCEDTRRTRKLLSALQIPAPRLVRLDQHSEHGMADYVVRILESGSIGALVSDAGMPTISDPGSGVVRACAEAGITVEVVPGPSAVSAALAVSGLAASRYRFEGFLARKGRDRAAQLKSVAAERMTTVVYESPHRVSRTVGDLSGACGKDRPIALARELTKVHEETWRGTLGDAVEWLQSAPQPPRGEWVLVIGGLAETEGDAIGAGAASGEVDDDAITAAIRSKTAVGIDRRQAVAEVAVELRVPRRRVYALAVSLRDTPR
jgi:16S rRNA (cytidine1402-2'-O)-methyltransferase